LPVSFTEVLVSFNRCALLRYLQRLILASERTMSPTGLFVLLVSLQVPFARYIARCGVSYLKRYSIDNVYRESRLVGLHPRELSACSFDIVTTPGGQSLVADAEVIAVVSEIVHEVPNLGARNCRLRLNHTALVKAMLLHCGVAESLHADIYAILGDSKVCSSLFSDIFLLALSYTPF